MGCNAVIGIPDHLDEEPWRSISIVSAWTLWALPALSVIMLLLAAWFKGSLRTNCLKAITRSPFLVLILFLVTEMSIPNDANMRIDLFITIPVIVIQLAFAAFAKYLQHRWRLADV